MNTQKLIAIAAAILINCAVLAWFNGSPHAAGAAAANRANTRQDIPTLPAVTVRPSADPMRMLRRARAGSDPAQSTSVTCSACGTPHCGVATACVAIES